MSARGKPIPPMLKLALDLGPLLFFFVGNALYGIFAGTAIFMVAMLAALVTGVTIERKVSPMPILTAVIVLVFGGLTLWLKNDIFIKIKPTILYMIFAIVLTGGLAFRRLFIKTVLGTALQLPDHAWRVLTWRWAAFFVTLAIANEFVWRHFSTDSWVAFKVWGIFPLTLLFALSQAPFLARHQIPEQNTAE
jgi:intracellular septation protein